MKQNVPFWQSLIKYDNFLQLLTFNLKIYSGLINLSYHFSLSINIFLQHHVHSFHSRYFTFKAQLSKQKEQQHININTSDLQAVPFANSYTHTLYSI